MRATNCLEVKETSHHLAEVRRISEESSGTDIKWKAHRLSYLTGGLGRGADLVAAHLLMRSIRLTYPNAKCNGISGVAAKVRPESFRFHREA